MNADKDFPRLTDENHRLTSPAAIGYNCVAWAAGDTENWWQPGVFWPTQPLPNEFGIGALEDAFKALGFEPCDDDRLETGVLNSTYLSPIKISHCGNKHSH